jgi:putative membrane protein
MNADFNTPQRQSAVGIIIMAADTTQKLIRAFFFPIILLFVKSETSTLIYVGIAIALFFIGIVVFAYLSYRNFIFYLDEEQQAFIVHHGVFNKTQLSVQLNNIQQVSISQNFLQKIIGIYGLKIDTPGTEKQEISIKAIEEGLANQLKQRLLNSQQFNNSSFAQTITEDTSTAMLQISAATLFKVGLTSNYGSSLAVLIGFSYAVFS